MTDRSRQTEINPTQIGQNSNQHPRESIHMGKIDLKNDFIKIEEQFHNKHTGYNKYRTWENDEIVRKLNWEQLYDDLPAVALVGANI